MELAHMTEQSFPMTAIDPALTTLQLLRMAADHHQQKVTLSDGDKKLLIALLKERGAEELEFGEELEVDGVRMVRRVTGAVGVYFS
jgi:hypothetical protein